MWPQRVVYSQAFKNTPPTVLPLLLIKKNEMDKGSFFSPQYIFNISSVSE